MNKGIAILAVCALFFSGIAIGALGMHLYYAQRLAHPGAPPAMATRMLGGHLDRRLDLTAEQQREIGRILAESRREAAEIRDRMRPEVEALVQRTEERIAAVLTEEQRRQFEEMRRFERRRVEQFLLGPVAPRAPGARGRRGPWREPVPAPPAP